MKTMITACGITLAILTQSHAFAGQYEIDQIESAAAKLDINALELLTHQVDGYDKGLAYYRLALSANLQGQTKSAIKWIDDAIALLEALESAQPDEVEVKALLAQVYGYKIAMQPMKGMFYGAKSSTMLDEAKTLSPNNPRVHLIQGIAKFNTPGMFGGSRKEAEDAFTAAISAYGSDLNSNYHWGFAETYTWRGVVNMKSGKLAQAKQDWQKALDINPDYDWAKTLLNQHQ